MSDSYPSLSTWEVPFPLKAVGLLVISSFPLLQMPLQIFLMVATWIGHLSTA